MRKSISASVLADVVSRKIYGEAAADDATGQKTFVVKMTVQQGAEDGMKGIDVNVRAETPEEAKAKARNIADEKGYTSVRIDDVMMTPNSDEELNDYGSGASIGGNPNDKKGMVPPSAVSKDLSDDLGESEDRRDRPFTNP